MGAMTARDSDESSPAEDAESYKAETWCKFPLVPLCKALTVIHSYGRMQRNN